jgi:ubiquinone/menaquinone biosynthesis C-methylase UbiE
MVQLNLGCGQYRAPIGWINIDHPSAESDPQISADIYCNALDLPFKDGCASRIYAGHIIEHFEEHELYSFFAEIDRVLEVDGVFMIVSPDMDRINALEEPEPWLLKAMELGNEGREGEHHKWQPTAAGVLSFLEHEGFDAKEVDLATIKADEWPLVAYTTWQFAIEAKNIT